MSTSRSQRTPQGAITPWTSRPSRQEVIQGYGAAKKHIELTTSRYHPLPQRYPMMIHLHMMIPKTTTIRTTSRPM